MLPLLSGGNRDPKKAATMILSVGDDEKKTEAKDGVDQDSNPALAAAADDVMKAFEMKSAKLLTSALKAFVEVCMDSEEYSEPAEEEVSL